MEIIYVPAALAVLFAAAAVSVGRKTGMRAMLISCFGVCLAAMAAMGDSGGAGAVGAAVAGHAMWILSGPEFCCAERFGREKHTGTINGCYPAAAGCLLFCLWISARTGMGFWRMLTPIMAGAAAALVTAVAEKKLKLDLSGMRAEVCVYIGAVFGMLFFSVYTFASVGGEYLRAFFVSAALLFVLAIVMLKSEFSVSGRRDASLFCCILMCLARFAAAAAQGIM